MSTRDRRRALAEEREYERGPSFDVMLPLAGIQASNPGPKGGSQTRSAEHLDGPPSRFSSPRDPSEMSTLLTLSTAAVLASAAAASFASGRGGHNVSHPSATPTVPEPTPSDPFSSTARVSVAYGSSLFSPMAQTEPKSVSGLSHLPPFADAAEVPSSGKGTILVPSPDKGVSPASKQKHAATGNSDSSGDDSLSDSLERLLPPPDELTSRRQRAEVCSGTTLPHGSDRLLLNLPCLPGISKDEQLLLTSLRSMGEAFSSTSSQRAGGAASSSASFIQGPSRMSSFRAAGTSLSGIRQDSPARSESASPHRRSSPGKISRSPSREIVATRLCPMPQTDPGRLSEHDSTAATTLAGLSRAQVQEESSRRDSAQSRDAIPPLKIRQDAIVPLGEPTTSQEDSLQQQQQQQVRHQVAAPTGTAAVSGSGSVDRVLSAVLERLEVLGSSVDELRGSLSDFRPASSRTPDSRADGQQDVLSAAAAATSAQTPDAGIVSSALQNAMVSIPCPETCAPSDDTAHQDTVASGAAGNGDIPLAKHVICTDRATSTGPEEAAGVSMDDLWLIASESKLKAEEDLMAVLAASEAAFLEEKTRMMIEVSETLGRLRAERDATAAATEETAAMLRAEREAVATAVGEAAIRATHQAEAMKASLAAASWLRLKSEETDALSIGDFTSNSEAITLSDGQFSKNLPCIEHVNVPSLLMIPPSGSHKASISRQGPIVAEAASAFWTPLRSERQHQLSAMPRLEPRTTETSKPPRRRGEQRRRGSRERRDHESLSRVPEVASQGGFVYEARDRQPRSPRVLMRRSLVQGLYIVVAGLMGGQLASDALANVQAAKAGMRLE